MFSSSSINGSVIDLPSSVPPPSYTLHAAFFLPTPQRVSDLLQEFPDLLQSDGFTAAPPRQHHILTVALILPSFLMPRQCIPPWKKHGLSAVLLLHEPLLSTWSRRNMEVGGCVVITAGSILPWLLIVTTFQTSPTSLLISVVLLSF